MKNKAFFLGAIALAALASGCSGGGGGSSTPSMPAPPITVGQPTSAPTTAPAQISSISGSVFDGTSSAALQGATVMFGTIPNRSTCNGAQTQSLNVCGTSSTIIASAQTSASGSFGIPAIDPGNYMLTVTKDGSFATLHRTITVATGANSVSNVSLLELTASQQAWLAEVNNGRMTISSPMSFGNLVVDEYAQEQAVRWAKDEAAGSIPYTDASYGPYQSAYGSSPGALFGAAGVLALGAPQGKAYDHTMADGEWFGEKINCPNGNWQTCTFAGNTGHYINISNTNTVWLGLGESDGVNSSAEHAYDIMLIENVGSVAPASKVRAI